MATLMLMRSTVANYLDSRFRLRIPHIFSLTLRTRGEGLQRE
jgi:hypothetical protein